MLIEMRRAWDIISGPIDEKAVNHGLGGLLLLDEVPEIGQPKNILAWGGAWNTIWFACREIVVAGFFSTQIEPFGDGAVKDLVNAWKKDFWTTIRAPRCIESDSNRQRRRRAGEKFFVPKKIVHTFIFSSNMLPVVRFLSS